MLLFRKTALAAALSGAISLGGCVTTDQVNTTVSEIQQATVLACGFLPTVSTVSALIAAFIPGASPIQGVAASTAAGICSAVTPAKAGMRRGGAAVPSYNGVEIKGSFVR